MKLVWWRIAMLIACLYTLVNMAFDIASFLQPAASIGYSVSAQRGDDGRVAFKISSVRKDSPAQAAGLRKDDVFNLADFSLHNRLQYSRAVVGDRFVLRVERIGTAPFKTTLVIGRRDAGKDNAVSFVYLLFRLALVAVAMLIVLRSYLDPAARSIAVLFVLLACSFFPPGGGADWFLIAATLVQTGSIFLAVGIAAHFAATFPIRSERGVRRWIAVGALPAGVAFTVLAVSTTVWSILADGFPFTGFQQVITLGYLVFAAAITTAFWIGNRNAQGSDLLRVRWISLSLAVGFSGAVASLVWLLVDGYQLQPWMQYVQFTLLAIPIGISYAIVRHRVIDIGFAINRAIVFGIVSALLVLAMGTLEWFLGKFIVESSHIANISLEMGFALILGYSLRHIHKRVDRIVDDVFFRDRHRAERALHRFADDASHITDMPTLMERTASTLQTQLQLTSCGVWLIEDGTAFIVAGHTASSDSLNENDPALVRLRATREPLEASLIDTQFAAAWLFPMFVRGTLSGVIACGQRQGEEVFTPDDVANVARVAHEVALSTDSLRTELLKRAVDDVIYEGASLDALRRAARLRLAPSANETGGAVLRLP